MDEKDKNIRDISRQSFIETLIKCLSEKMGQKYQISLRDVRKNNGVVLQGLEIGMADSMVKPCIYIDGLYQKYKKGSEIDEIASFIMREYKEHRDEIKQDISYFNDYEKICKNIRGKLINTEKNSDMLMKVPHRKFLDLSLVYYIEFPLEAGNGTVQITDWFLDVWNVTEEDLYDRFMTYMKSEGNYVIKGLGEMLKRLLPDEDRDCIQDAFCPMYVLTNANNINGAVGILGEGALEQASEVIGRNIMVIPSSINEMILVPDDGTEDFADKVALMVKEINDTQLLEQEVLSYHVYRYDMKQKKLEIAA